MAITQAKWQRPFGGGDPTTLEVVEDGNILIVPADLSNRHFNEVIDRESSGLLVIDPPDPEPEAKPPELTPKQFEWLLAISGLDDVWDAAQKQAKVSGDMQTYAFVKAQRSSQTYVQADTLAFKNSPAILAVAQAVAPEADLSDANIINLWEIAAQQTFTSPPT